MALRNPSQKKLSHIMLLVFFVIVACYNPFSIESSHNINTMLIEKNQNTVFENFTVNSIVGSDATNSILQSGKHHENEEEESDENTAFGGKPEHIELAYRLCSDPNVKEPKCHAFRNNFQALKRSYVELKSDYCSKHNHVCQELGL